MTGEVTSSDERWIARCLELAIGVWNAIPLAGFDNRFQDHPKGHPVGAIAYGEVSYAF